MNPPKETIRELVERLMCSDSPREQVEIAGELRSRAPERRGDLRMLNRAIAYFREAHPEVYERAKNPAIMPFRSIPPSSGGGAMEYLRLEEACTRLVQAKQTWNRILREIQDGLYPAPKRSEREDAREAIREMGRMLKTRKGKPSKTKRTPDAHKPKRRLHS